MISYQKFFDLLSRNGLSQSTFIRETEIYANTIDIMAKGNKFISTKTVDKICMYLNCQPNDIMEYIPDDEFIRQTEEKISFNNARIKAFEKEIENLKKANELLNERLPK